MNFGEALEIIKEGGKASRRGWNGKNQYIMLGTGITYQTIEKQEGKKVHVAFHEDIGSRAIVFVGTRGEQVGWLASQSDMLAEDWECAGAC